MLVPTRTTSYPCSYCRGSRYLKSSSYTGEPSLRRQAGSQSVTAVRHGQSRADIGDTHSRPCTRTSTSTQAAPRLAAGDPCWRLLRYLRKDPLVGAPLMLLTALPPIALDELTFSLPHHQQPPRHVCMVYMLGCSATRV